MFLLIKELGPVGRWFLIDYFDHALHQSAMLHLPHVKLIEAIGLLRGAKGLSMLKAAMPFPACDRVTAALLDWL